MNREEWALWLAWQWVHLEATLPGCWKQPRGSFSFNCPCRLREFVLRAWEELWEAGHWYQPKKRFELSDPISLKLVLCCNNGFSLLLNFLTGNFIAFWKLFWMSYIKWLCYSPSNIWKSLSLGAPLHLLISHPYSHLKFTKLELYSCPTEQGQTYRQQDRQDSPLKVFYLLLQSYSDDFFPSLELCSQEVVSLKEQKRQSRHPTTSQFWFPLLPRSSGEDIALQSFSEPLWEWGFVPQHVTAGVVITLQSCKRKAKHHITLC